MSIAQTNFERLRTGAECNRFDHRRRVLQIDRLNAIAIEEIGDDKKDFHARQTFAHTLKRFVSRAARRI